MEITTTMLSNPLPDFSRVQWSSSSARNVWEPRIRAIARAWEATERASVGVFRKACRQVIAPEAMPEVTARAAQAGLVVASLAQTPRSQSYSASSSSLQPGQAWDYHVVIANPAHASAFVRAWHDSDDATIGRLLGYPECCIDFYHSTWKAGSVDPTWHMGGQQAGGGMDDPLHGVARGPIEANLLLRWAGVRWVSHMPCSFDCSHTELTGRMFRAVMRKDLGLAQEAEWLDEMLSWPMLWTSLFGIGEVTTPIAKLNFRSEMDYELREIRREGTRYPDEGARGLVFPYTPPRVCGTPEVKPMLFDRTGSTLWTDNGFSSRDAMKAAHSVVASVAPHANRVMDLGCGNGVLARRIASESWAGGVEADPARAKRAEARLDHVLVSDLTSNWVEYQPDLVLLMPGRIIESDDPEAIRAQVRRVPRVLVYAYGDWLTRYSSLDALCRAAGLLGTLEGYCTSDGVAAALWQQS